MGEINPLAFRDNLHLVPGHNLRRIRQEYKLSQEKLGDLLNVTYRQVEEHEISRYRIPTTSLFYLSHLMTFDVREFAQSEDIEADNDDEINPIIADIKNAEEIFKIFNAISDPKIRALLRVMIKKLTKISSASVVPPAGSLRPTLASL